MRVELNGKAAIIAYIKKQTAARASAAKRTNNSTSAHAITRPRKIAKPAKSTKPELPHYTNDNRSIHTYPLRVGREIVAREMGLPTSLAGDLARYL